MIRRLFRQINKNESGVSLIEFALVLPILLLILLGIIQFGFIFNGQITLTSSAREGARLAVVGADDNDVKDRVEDTAIALLLNVDRNDIDINREVGGDDGTLSVTVPGSVDIIVPILDLIVGNSMSLSAESVMRVELKP